MARKKLTEVDATNHADKVFVNDSETVKQITTGELLGNMIRVEVDEAEPFAMMLEEADVVNNLTSDATNKPLSAAMGKSLKEDLTQLSNKFYDKVTTEYEGLKIDFERIGNMVICSVPTITPKTIAGWGNVKIGNIPAGFVPRVSYFFPVCFQTTTNHLPVFFNVNQSVLMIFNQSGNQVNTTNTMLTTLTWLTS